MVKHDTINPTSLKGALESLAGSNIIPIAGGTDLLVKLHGQYDKPWPSLLVLERVKPLHKIQVKKNTVAIGPLLTFSDIEQSTELKKYAFQLAEAASVAGSTQIRNRATIGGNVANGSPSGDLLPPLYVLGAKLRLASVNGSRTVPVEDFFEGPGRTIKNKKELITAIEFDKSYKAGFFNRLATRKALAISKVSVAANISLKKNRIENIKIALGAVAPTVIRAYETEEYLKGKMLNDDVLDKAIGIITSEAKPIDDLRSLAEYRKEMVGVLFKRGIEKYMQVN